MMNDESMLFTDVDGRPVPVLPDAGDGSARVADGVAFFSLPQAAEHFKMSEAALRLTAEAFFRDLIPEGAEPTSPTAAAATIASPTRASLLRRYLYPDLSEEHCGEFLRRCDHHKLDPWCKQIYPRIVHDDEAKRPSLFVEIAIGGLRALGHRTGTFAGVDAPKFTYGEHEKFPVKCEITVYKMVQGQRVPFYGTAQWEEFYPAGDVPTLWDEKPERCLETPAEAQALRRAFELDGLYAPEELVRRRERMPARRAPAFGLPDDVFDANLHVSQGEVEELDLPTTQHSFEVRLAHLEVPQAKRTVILAALKNRFPKLYMNAREQFYQRAFAHLMANPAAFGVAVPVAAGAEG